MRTASDIPGTIIDGLLILLTTILMMLFSPVESHPEPVEREVPFFCSTVPCKRPPVLRDRKGNVVVSWKYASLWQLRKTK